MPASLYGSVVKDSVVPDVYVEVVPLGDRALTDDHKKILEEESGIAPDIIEARGYHSITRDHVRDLIQREVMNPAAVKGDGWLAIPILRPDGQKHGEVVRVDHSPLKQKYVWPTGLRTALDIHPFCFDSLDDRDVPVCFIEGIKKADAVLSAARRENIAVVVVALNGNYGWRSTVEGGKTTSPDLLDIPLNDRRVFVLPDSDYRSNDMVARGWDEFALYLAGKTGDHRTFVAVVPPAGLAKQGADDYLAAGGTLTLLLGLAQSPKQAKQERGQEEPTPLLIKSGTRLILEAGKEIPHLIRPLLPEASIILIAGHSGTLKTWHMLSMMADLAMGKKWLDHPSLGTPNGPVNCLYVNKEMSGIVLGQRLRLLMNSDRYKGDIEARDYALENRIFTVDEAILDLKSEAQRDRLEEAIIMNNIGMVFLDSFSMCWSGDENSNSEVGVLYTQLRTITERTHVAWGPVHHLDKPQSGKSRLPAMFSIRGAGQLVQQADAAIILSKFDPPVIEPDCKQIQILHAKARTSEEIAGWITQFKDEDGMGVSLTYHSQLQGAQEKSYVDSGKDPTYLDEWLIRTFQETPALHPTSRGVRMAEMLNLLPGAWESKKAAPSNAVLKKRVEAMAERGDLMQSEVGTKMGPLYHLSPTYTLTPDMSTDSEVKTGRSDDE